MSAQFLGMVHCLYIPDLGLTMCATSSESQKLVVTGDKDGLVKLFNYPCPQWGSDYKEYRMHSTFVQGRRAQM